MYLIYMYLGSIGVTFSSERAMRKRQNVLLNDNLRGSLVPLVFNSDKASGHNGVELRDVPFVTVKNLSSMILDYLDRHDLYGSLNWHDGVIPKDEVWIKVGGDKGGKSFKLSFQIVNTHYPNSLQINVVFACFEPNDSIANLQTVLPPVLEQVSQLTGHKWRDKTLRLFLFGDYELLTCDARYCCLYCTTSKDNMRLPITERATATPRTMQSILQSYKAYEADGSVKARSKDVSHSIIAKPIIDIATDHVSRTN
ncbi:uncharacterized protein LOC119733077 [Patiria miniata]|uniref:Uncharacterized protein n=1 Tax=Patiria miniata TaxID=46514 RepID=A0A914AFS4_PATMI|nr:uncharacterized protein LOC119733077 [Patiria miniata]